MSEEVTEKKMSQVEAEFLTLVQVEDRLDTLISEVEERLAPVLRGEIPDQDEDVQKELALVPLADRVRGIRYKSEQKVNRLVDLLNRIEL